MKKFLSPFILIGIIVISGCQRDEITSTWVPKEDAPQSAPNVMSRNPNEMMPPATEQPQKDIQWKVPAAWTEQPASAMRIGSFLAKGANGQPVDISVIPLSGSAGGALANINRWRGQINLSPLAEADLPKHIQTLQVGRHQLVIVDFVSEQNLIDNQYKKRLVAAMTQEENRSLFFKMVGEDSAVANNKPSFVQFLKSVKF